MSHISRVLEIIFILKMLLPGEDIINWSTSQEQFYLERGARVVHDERMQTSDGNTKLQKRLYSAVLKLCYIVFRSDSEQHAYIIG